MKDKVERISDAMELLERSIPLVLPDIEVDGRNRAGWEFAVKVFDPKSWGEKGKPYLKYMYVNPKNKWDYIFCSAYIGELYDYLVIHGLIKMPEIDPRKRGL